MTSTIEDLARATQGEWLHYPIPLANGGQMTREDLFEHLIPFAVWPKPEVEIPSDVAPVVSWNQRTWSWFKFAKTEAPYIEECRTTCCIAGNVMLTTVPKSRLARIGGEEGVELFDEAVIRFQAEGISGVDIDLIQVNDLRPYDDGHYTRDDKHYVMVSTYARVMMGLNHTQSDWLFNGDRDEAEVRAFLQIMLYDHSYGMWNHNDLTRLERLKSA